MSKTSFNDEPKIHICFPSSFKNPCHQDPESRIPDLYRPCSSPSRNIHLRALRTRSSDYSRFSVSSQRRGFDIGHCLHLFHLGYGLHRPSRSTAVAVEVAILRRTLNRDPGLITLCQWYWTVSDISRGYRFSSAFTSHYSLFGSPLGSQIQEHPQYVLVLFTATGATPGVDIEAL